MKRHHTSRTYKAGRHTRSIPVYGLAIVAGLVLLPGVVDSAPHPDRTVEPAVNCRAVSSSKMKKLRSDLSSAYDFAYADAKTNGSNGEYAVAATNSRDLIKRALDRADRMIADHGKSDPRTTTYAEAGTTKEHTRSIIEVLPQAAHWAVISNIYHKSADARRAFDRSVDALDVGLQLFVDASNCYMDGYTP